MAACHVATHTASSAGNGSLFAQCAEQRRTTPARCRRGDSCARQALLRTSVVVSFSPCSAPSRERKKRNEKVSMTKTRSLTRGRFLSGQRLTAKPLRAEPRSGNKGTCGARAALNDIPKQFREENLREGLTENFKNVPEFLYGLNPSQINMFVPEDGPVRRKTVTPEMITSAAAYREGGGMHSLFGVQDKSRLSMSVSMYAGGGYGRPKTSPPDLPSLLLDARICYLGMPIVPAVTELIIAELLWLNYDNPSKPIYFYINSPGTQNDQRESIGFETEAYAIADTMNAKELHANTCYYVDLLARGTGKKPEDLYIEIQRPSYFWPEEAIEYGLIDKIIQDRDVRMEKINYDEMLAQQKAIRGPGRPGAPMVQQGPPA
ncbi:hypothetical protein CBR_g39885 [Chara braunii]|uniref:ATP-dependent Clp protease proteolytic subunit n=1 Tax=Chara braunii TaxID=69332 RepID=A0A388LSK9_CHABU|nr:hypothetical protein CBR_g39885 [Chara braunii]|eukprot:GBG85318.1 hypothetical protein CBR_g39885 [Chara braunii]